MSRFGNNCLFFVYCPSFQDKAVALEIEKLLVKAKQRIQPYESGGKAKFVHHRVTRAIKYIVIEQELTSEQLNEISTDYEWWTTHSINIITTDSLFSELMKWNQLNSSIQQPKMIKLWDKWKHMINNEKNNNETDVEIDNDVNNEIAVNNEIEIEDENGNEKENQNETGDGDYNYIKFEYVKVTKKPDQYLLSFDNIWRLYDICNEKNNLHQQLEVISTETVSYICGIEWDYNEEKQSKLNNNPCWDKKNQKRKEGTGYAIEYGMRFIFGSGNQALTKDWWKKKALFFTLNDVPVTYDSINSDKQYVGQHWFSIAVQQYHDNQIKKITKIDWNIFDSFNDKNIINKYKNSHIEPIKCFLNHIYNKMNQWNITIPEQPNQTMYQHPQIDNFCDCGIYCCIALNYLFQQFIGLIETNKNQNKNKNKNKNREQNIKLPMSDLHELPMPEGIKGVITLRDLLTNDIKQQYESIMSATNVSKENPFENVKIDAGQYVSYREKSGDPLPKSALSWKYVGKVISIGKNKKSDEIHVVGINKSENDNVTELKSKTINFINNYEWRVMNDHEKNGYKLQYQKKIENHSFNKKSSNNNDSTTNSINNNDDNVDNEDNKDDKNNNKNKKNDNPQQPKKRQRKKRNAPQSSSSIQPPSKKRKIDNTNSNASQPKREIKSKQKHNNNQISKTNSDTESEIEEGEIKEEHSSSSSSEKQPPSKKRKLMKTSLKQIKKE